MKKFDVKYVLVALSVVGSAILLSSCDKKAQERDPKADEAMMTEYCEELSIIESQNGRRSYHFYTPLVEGYAQAREPYREFRKGIKITTFQDDSLTTVDNVMTANYAIHYGNRELWEAKGNVVVKKADGKTLYTQQLFWNARTKKIYSNVDSKIVEGNNVWIGEGFESDEQFRNWRFRRGKSHMEVDFTPRESADSLPAEPRAEVKPVRETPAVESAPKKESRRELPKKDPKDKRVMLGTDNAEGLLLE